MECRICRCGAEEDSPLFHPCHCTGSIRYVHEECLMHWLETTHSHICETCGHALQFSPVYLENTPKKIYFLEICEIFCEKKFSFFFWKFARLVVVMGLWLIVTPMFASGVFGYVRNEAGGWGDYELGGIGGNAQNRPVLNRNAGVLSENGLIFTGNQAIILGNGASRDDLNVVGLLDESRDVFLQKLPVLEGSSLDLMGDEVNFISNEVGLLRKALLMIGSRVELLKNFFTQKELFQNQVENQAGGLLKESHLMEESMDVNGVLSTHDAVLEQREARLSSPNGANLQNDDGIESLLSLPKNSLLQPPPTASKGSLSNNTLFTLLRQWERGVWICVFGLLSLFVLVTVFDFVRGYELGEFDEELAMAGGARQQAGIAEEDNDEELDDAGEPPPLVAPMQPLPPPQLPQVQLPPPPPPPPLHNNDDADADGFNFEQLGFDEWLGIRGPWCAVFNNALCLCFCILLFLVTFYVLPENLGRGVVGEMEKAVQIFGQSSWGEAIEKGIWGKNRFRIATEYELRSSVACPSPSVRDVFGLAAAAAADAASPTCPTTYLQTAATQLYQYQFETVSVLLGLVLTMTFIQMQFQACALTWRFANRIIAPRTFPHRAWQSTLHVCRTIVRIQKVVTMLVVKMIFFPMVLGCLLDYAARPAIASTEQDRLLFVAEYPHLALLLLWISGITHTLLITMNVILVRDVLHHDVLDWIIRIRDPNANQFLPLLVDSIWQHARRIVLTCGIYAAIIYAFVRLPLVLIQAMNPKFLPLPLTIKFYVVALELPAHLVLFHMWMLWILERAKPTMIKAQSRFLTVACRMLGLTEFLMPIPVNSIAYADALRRARVQAGQLHFLDSAPRVDITLLQPRVKPTNAWARVLVLIAWIWVVSSAVMCALLLIPFFAGYVTVLAFPMLPDWVLTDVRLYVVGFTVLRRLGFAILRLRVNMVPRAYKVWVVCFAMICVLPWVCGVFVHICLRAVAVDDSLSDVFTKLFQTVSGIRIWLAGALPARHVVFSTKLGDKFWRAMASLNCVVVMKKAAEIVSFCAFSGFVGVLSGWILTDPQHHEVGIHVGLGMVGIFLWIRVWLQKFSPIFKRGYQKIHDSLKDEKYLLKKRLRNFGE